LKGYNINKKDKKVTLFKYDDAGDFKNGLAKVKFNNKWGYINKYGKVVIDFQFDGAGDFSEKVAWVKVNKNYGLINKQGKYVIIPKYDFAKDFSEGLAAVKLNEKYGYINKKDEVKISFKYDEALLFKNGVATVGKKKYPVKFIFGFINAFGEGVTPIKYEGLGDEEEYIRAVIHNGKIGWVDIKGTEYWEP